MKKGIIVLLVAVLVAGSVFAATMTGNASINAGYNLQTTEWGLKDGTAMSAGFTFELAADSGDFGSKGEGDLYAEIAADFSGSIKAGASDKVWVDAGYWYQAPSNNGTGSKVDFNVGGSWTARITKANIIYKDITIGILNAGGGYDYAKTYYKEVSDSATHTYKAASKVKMGNKLVDGFTVTYGDLFTAGFGAEGKVNEKSYKIFGQAQVTAIENLKLAGYGYLSNEGKQVGAAAAYEYATDKLSAKVAADFTYKSTVHAALEASASVAYENYAVDVYYVTVDNFTTNKLDAMASVSFDDGVVAATFVDVRDIIGNAQDIYAEVDFNDGIVLTDVYAATNVGDKTFEVGCDGKVDAVKFGASYGFAYDFSAHQISAKVEYKAEMFTAKANTKIAFTSTAVTKAEVGASISSTKLIDNCTVSLAYSKANFAKGAAHNLGKIDLTATIAF